MSQDQIDAKIMGLVRERQDLKPRLVALNVEAASVGNDLISLGQDLSGQPHVVAIMGQHHSIQEKGNSHSSGILDASRIAKLVQDIRDTSRRIDEITVELSKAGL